MRMVRDAFHSWLYQQWHDLPANPRTAGSDSVIYSTCESWFADTPFGEMDLAQPQSWCPDYVHNTAGLNKVHLASLMRFRLGAHDLRVATGRWERVDGRQLPRHQRLCTLCLADQVEVEFHMVFECDAYESIREQFWYLFDEFGDWVSPRDTVRPDEIYAATTKQRCCLSSLLLACKTECSTLADRTCRVTQPPKAKLLTQAKAAHASKAGLCVATLSFCRECFLVLRILNFRSWLKFLIDWCFFQFVLDPMSLVWLLVGGPVALLW
jgi:hypothetical protein